MMQVGLIGLGKMGLNLGKNLLDHKHQVVAYDLNPNAVEEMKKYGAKGTTNLSELIPFFRQHQEYFGSWYHILWLILLSVKSHLC